MKNITAALLIALATVSGLQAQRSGTRRARSRSETPIVAATYNIRMNNSGDGVNAWPNRAEWVRRLVRFHEWDIFGTQEGFRTQLDDLAQMEEYAWIGVGRDDGIDKGEHSAIFYRRERFDLLDYGNFWLSQTPDIPSRGWDAAIKRICSWGRFRDRITRRVFYFFCAHYDHIGRKARVESSRLILAKIAAIAGDTPAIFVGDLNSAPGGEAIAVFDGVMLDTFHATTAPPYGPAGTFQGFDWRRGDGGDRIDYIFCTPGTEVVKYGVLSDSQNKRFPSDHYPVMTEIVIE